MPDIYMFLLFLAGFAVFIGLLWPLFCKWWIRRQMREFDRDLQEQREEWRKRIAERRSRGCKRT